MSTKILESVFSKKDAHLFRHFCGGHDGNEDEHDSADSQPLDTTEVDITAVLNQPLNDLAKSFYDKEKSEVAEAILKSVKPWANDPNYFQKVYVSSLALLKMTVHAKSGGSIEVMGMLTGKIAKNSLIVMDVYPLPVEGTETRVNAQSEGYEFMVQYLANLKKSGRTENIVGWYHSHPGYGCWLSGIDVGTQSLNQQFQDPYLAIVVDPMRTTSNGLVEIGAFRTYSEEYSKTHVIKNNAFGSLGSAGASPANAKQLAATTVNGKKKGTQNIPEDKIKDFGMHASRYYSLPVEIFRSEADHMILSNLWNKFWISSLIGSTNDAEQKADMEKFVNEKLAELEKKVDLLKKNEAVKPAQTNARPGVRRYKTPADERPEPRDFASTFMDRFQPNHHHERLSPSLLQKSQLSPFTKANMLSKMSKEKEVSSDGSDSEMNDIDSDLDMRQETDDDSAKPEIPSSQNTAPGHSRRQRHRFVPQIISPTQPDSGVGQHSDAMSIKRRKENDQVKTSAAEASRNLMNLKLQEIIFLNE